MWTLFPAIFKQGGILPNIIGNQLWFLARASALHYSNNLRDIKQIFTYFFIYFNLGDGKGEPHTLGELFLSLKSDGDTNPQEILGPFLGVLGFRFY